MLFSVPLKFPSSTAFSCYHLPLFAKYGVVAGFFSFSFSTIVFFALLHVHLRPLSYINLAADDDEDLGGGKNQSRSSYARPTFIFRVGKEEGRTPQKGGECGARFKEKKRESGGKEKLDCQKKKGGKKRYLGWI